MVFGVFDFTSLGIGGKVEPENFAFLSKFGLMELGGLKYVGVI